MVQNIEIIVIIITVCTVDCALVQYLYCSETVEHKSYIMPNSEEYHTHRYTYTLYYSYLYQFAVSAFQPMTMTTTTTITRVYDADYIGANITHSSGPQQK